MENKSKTAAFRAADVLLILMMILPIVAGWVLKALFTPESEGIAIKGALIYLSVHAPIQDFVLTEAQVNSWLVMISVTGLCLYLTHGIRARVATKRQYIAEWIVEKAEGLIKENMDGYFDGFAPFIAAMLALSAFSSLLSLTGLFAPTSDLNVVAGWAILTFALITYYKMKCGPLVYCKSFGEPVGFLAPLNIISEFATPVSMAFRHYGNILSGSVISVLIAAGLQGLSSAVLGHLPGFIGEFPLFRIGIPAVLSIYFDVFSGLLQAYIFAMLTMLYVSGAFPADEYARRHSAKTAEK
ncbi:F-type H+-transporting ATPase subunit a [Ruminococcus sp. YE71]|uniref:F0F1 ATP synthase subunit A n=1 Tax=unclassified Ruminococcus TaxID=2608920 RepID=UPI00088C1646|nr:MULTISPECIES: FoF1 ATP synthase subunit a [unclassified Ruminococcus]SDA09430.1 F-type H+-transporting ATPase subunit a [Ruminococcus sp. YE78]SFW12285.1 F-type H+-transporting ATPase subunit a [Ruminococcus sp. YE71]